MRFLLPLAIFAGLVSGQDLELTEIVNSKPGNTAGDFVWIEIVNDDPTTALDISNFTLDGIGGQTVIPPGTVIPPMGIVIVTNAPAAGTNATFPDGPSAAQLPAGSPCHSTRTATHRIGDGRGQGALSATP